MLRLDGISKLLVGLLEVLFGSRGWLRARHLTQF